MKIYKTHHSIDPQEVIDFIDANFDLHDKTGGLVSTEEKLKLVEA